MSPSIRDFSESHNVAKIEDELVNLQFSIRFPEVETCATVLITSVPRWLFPTVPFSVL